MRPLRSSCKLVLCLTLLCLAAPAASYPLDGAQRTGIARLEAYQLLRESLIEQGRLRPGSLLGTRDIVLRLHAPDFELPTRDKALSKRLAELFGEDGKAYGAAVLDISDPSAPRYLEHRPKMKMQPASVGKILVALGWFQALADRFPQDRGARRRLLLNTVVTANDFIGDDPTGVPFWKRGDESLRVRPIAVGDSANLYTFLDWMISGRSDAAASMLIAELMLFEQFGRDYPLAPDEAEAFFRDTPMQDLGDLYAKVMHEPLPRNDLDPKRLRQGKFFTRTGKRRVPGLGNHATARELMKFLVQMEQGQLVDAFSSLELKRLLYLTDSRTRYAAAPALKASAVFTLSGTLESCHPEADFTCSRYMGNGLNYLTTIAVVEGNEDEIPLRYLVVISSNVLRKHSADDHQRLGSEIHELIRSLHRPQESSR